jgi:hypothetical protein
MKIRNKNRSASASIVTLLIIGLLLAPPAARRALAQCGTPPANVVVRERDGLVFTGLTVTRGDTINFSASGRIWAGVWLTGDNGPEGWADLRTAGTEFPLPGARIYGLLAQIGNDPPFYVGQGGQHRANSSGRLFLRINDNVAGNGNGQFNCTVRVSRQTSTVAADRTVSVPESTRGVSTGITINDGDRVVFEASSRIWAGVWLAGENGPEGWGETAGDRFPLAGARRFSLIGRIGGGRPFYIGQNNEIRHSGAPGQLTLLTNDDVPGNGNGNFICRVRVYRAGMPLNATLTGTATLTIDNPNTRTPFFERLNMVPIVFSQDRCSVSLVNFPPIVRTFPVPGGSNTATLTILSGGAGSFNPMTGRMDVPLTLRITNSHPFGGTSDLSLTLSTAAPGGRALVGGGLALAGSGRFTGGFLNGNNATLVVAGTISPTP